MNQPQELPLTEAQLEQGIANAKAFGGRTGQRAENVLTDMLKSLKKWKRLTDGQRRYASSLIGQVDPEILKTRTIENQAWEQEVKSDKELQAKISVVSEYYIKAGYYTSTANKCLRWLKIQNHHLLKDMDMSSQSYESLRLPPKAHVLKMIDNTYAQKVAKSAASEPIWKVGDIVACRSSTSGRFHLVSGEGQYWKNKGDGVYTIIQVDSRPIDKALSYKPKQGGSRYYRLLMFGSTRIIDVMEVDLKKVPKKLIS